MTAASLKLGVINLPGSESADEYRLTRSTRNSTAEEFTIEDDVCKRAIDRNFQSAASLKFSFIKSSLEVRAFVRRETPCKSIQCLYGEQSAASSARQVLR